MTQFFSAGSPCRLTQWIIPLLLFFTVLCCRTTGGLQGTPGIISELYQSTVYTGDPQAPEVRTAKAGVPLVLTYFEFLEELEKGEKGRGEPPVDAGLYYVRIERPEGNGYAAGQDVIMKFRIEQREVHIFADDIQEAFYDGNSKRVKAGADAPVRISIAYFPSPQARQAVTRADTRPEQRSAALKGLIRVERPPVEPGTYYVAVYYGGSRNYRPAAKEIEFTIKRAGGTQSPVIKTGPVPSEP